MSGDAAYRAIPTAAQVGPALVVTLPAELGDEAFAMLRETVLERVRNERHRALVLEASGLELIDAHEFMALAAVARSAAWLGARVLLVGLRPGIVAYLVDVAADTRAFQPFATLDDALAELGRGGIGR